MRDAKCALLADHYSQETQLESMELGEGSACVVRHLEDERWYRAQVSIADTAGSHHIGHWVGPWALEWGHFSFCNSTI